MNFDVHEVSDRPFTSLSLQLHVNRLELDLSILAVLKHKNPTAVPDSHKCILRKKLDLGFVQKCELDLGFGSTAKSSIWVRVIRACHCRTGCVHQEYEYE